MEKKVSYYVSRKNVFTWLTVLSLAASCILRVADANAAGLTPRFLLVTLPVIASLWFILILLIAGDEMLYKTTVPVWLIVLYYTGKTMLGPQSLKLRLLCTLFYVMIGFLYYEIVSGRHGRRFLLLIIMLTGLFFELRVGYANVSAGSLLPVRQEIPNVLMLLAGVFLVLGMKIHLDGKFHPSIGDRPDGRRLRTLDPFSQVTSYFLSTRTGSANALKDRVEVSAIDEYLQNKKKEGLKNISFMHVFMAAFVRCVAKYPAINRFVSGHRLYSRGKDILISMTIKSSLSLDAEESVVRVHLSPYDTVEDVYRKVDMEVERIKSNPVGDSSFDKTARYFSLIPGFLFLIVVNLLRFLDYFGSIPKQLLEISPFHGTIYFTNLASLGIPPVTHHLYNFGNVSLFGAFGAKYSENEIDKDGHVIRHRYIDYTFNTDDRIVDGYYYAQALKYIHKLLAHPEKLDVPPEEVNRDID